MRLMNDGKGGFCISVMEADTWSLTSMLRIVLSLFDLGRNLRISPSFTMRRADLDAAALLQVARGGKPQRHDSSLASATTSTREPIR
jgi:hypothetical protein